MKKKLLSTLLIMLAALLLVACGGATEPAADPVESDNTASETADTPATDSADTGETAVASAQTFTVVTAESQASYIVNEEFFADALSKLGIDPGKTVVTGTTPGVSGEIVLDTTSADPLQSAQFTVDMTQLATDQNRRDNWLRDNAIETSRFPQATFVATSASGLPSPIPTGEMVSFQLTGDLTVRDFTREVTFDVQATLTDNTITGTATLNLNISDFGITPPDFANTLTVADPFTIEVQLTARQS